MPSAPKHYPLLSDLIDETTIPGDLEKVEQLAGEGVDFLLGKLRYRDLLIEKSPGGDTAFYSVTVLAKELKLPLFGLPLDLVFFDGATLNFSDIPISFDWRWPIQKYFSGFSAQGFSYAPEAFLDILFELAEIDDEEELVESIVGAFLSDGAAPYLTFYTSITDRFTQLKSDWPAAAPEIDNILTEIDVIKTEIDNEQTADPSLSLLDIAIDYKNYTGIKTAVDSIVQSIQTIEDNTDAEIDYHKEFVATVLADVSDIDEKFDKLIALFRTWLGNITKADIEYLLIPQFEFSVREVNMALDFPRNWLRPLDAAGNVIDENANVAEKLKTKSSLTFDVGSLEYSTQTGFHFSGEKNFSFDKSMIGRTGLTIEFSDMKLDLSRETNIAEANAEGRPVDFMGVYAKEAIIGLPAKWFGKDSSTTLAIIGRELLMGTGGLSGRIGLEAIGAPGLPPPANAEMVFVLGKKPQSGPRKGFAIGFQKFHMVWQQNTVIESSVKGSLTIPKFKRCDSAGAPISTELRIEIEALFEQNGDFQVTAKPDGGLSLCLDKAFIATVDDLEVGKDDDNVYLEISGDLSFKNNNILKDILKDPIAVKKLRIYSDGGFEIEGGSIPLPDSAKLKLGPTEVFITNLTFGAEEREHNGVMRKFKFFGLDCGVSAGSAGLDLRGDGLAYYFTADDGPGKAHHSFLMIAGIGVDLVIPGDASEENAAIIIKGYLSIREEEYRGSISLALPKARIAGGASMMMKPKLPAWAIDAFLEMSVPIPLGPSGLGIFGFRGLFGYRYIAAREAIGLTQDDSWFDYYKKDVLPGGKGVHLGKLHNPDDVPDETAGAKNPISIGAGLTLATVSDDGKAFSLQAFILISLPELIFIQGKANVLGERVGLLEGEPPFFAFVAYSPGDSVEFGFGADYKKRETGDLIDLHAEVQAGFFMKNSGAWYIDFGRRSHPITARILSLFDAYSYLMLSASGIETGAGVSFGFSKKYGPVKAVVSVYIDIWGKLSYEGPQVGAGLALGGMVDVSIWGVGFGISIATTLEGAVPKPFRIAGTVEVCVYVKVLFKKFGKCFDVQFVWERDLSRDTSPIIPLLSTADGVTTKPSPVSAVHIGSGKTYPINYFGVQNAPPGPSQITRIIPLDSFVDIQFSKAVDASAVSSKIGGVTNAPVSNQELVPPKPAYGQVRHAYKIHDVEIFAWDGSAWTSYHPYEALTEGSVSADMQPNLSDLKLGFFQKTGKEYNKIRFLAQTPFSYMETSAGKYIPEQMGITSSTLFCKETERNWRCTSWRLESAYAGGQWYLHDGLAFRVKLGNAAVVDFPNVFQIPKSLLIPADSSVEIYLPESSISVLLKLFSHAEDVTIRYFKREKNILSTPYTEVLSVQASPIDLLEPIEYSDQNHPIDKIVIESQPVDFNLIQSLAVSIDELEELIYRSGPRSEDTQRLQAQLESLRLQYDTAQTPCFANQDGRGHIEDLVSAKHAEYEDQLADCSKNNQTLQEELARSCEAGSDRNEILLDCVRDLQFSFGEGDQISECIATIQEFLRPVPTQSLGLDYIKADLHLRRLIEQLIQHINRCSQSLDEQVNAILSELAEQITATSNACEKLKAELEANEQFCEELSDKKRQLELFLAGTASSAGQAQDNHNIKCAMFLHEVCWLSEEDYFFNQSIPEQDAIEEDFQLAHSAIEHVVAPIWRPSATFLIRASVSDSVDNTAPLPRNVYFGFRTDGPIGHFAEQNIVELEKFKGPPPSVQRYDERVETPETALKFYINSEKSYPDPTGKILNRKPVYYDNPRILLFYNQPFVYHFFSTWSAYNGLPPKKGALEILIKDPVEDISDPLATDHTSSVFTLFPTTQVAWLDDDDPIIASDIGTYDSLRNPENLNPSHPGADCWTSGGLPVKPRSKRTEIIPNHLKPSKLYTAIVRNNFTGSTKEVHKYAFQTSRFASLMDHIDSYHLQDDAGNLRDAIFEEAVDLDKHSASPADNIGRAFDIVKDDPQLFDPHITALADIYSDPFQRLTEGHLQLKAGHPPAGIEFNFLSEINSGALFALYVNSVEPLNSPLIDYGDLFNTVKVIVNGVTRHDYVPLFSKDRAKVILMNPNLQITAADLRLRFAYLEWNGAHYIEQAAATTTNLIL